LNNTESWWKLIREDLIDPASKEDRASSKQEGKKLVTEDDDNPDFVKFKKNMDVATILHERIADKYHPNTYAYYAADLKQLAWNEVHWKSESSFVVDLKAASVSHDDFNGTLNLYVEENGLRRDRTQTLKSSLEGPAQRRSISSTATNIVEINGIASTSAGNKAKYRFRIQKPEGPGDGTVPEESGAAPTSLITQIFRHEGKAKGHESYDHQSSYKAKIAQSVTLYSIIKIVAQSDWLKNNLCR
jgi:hypothetical protein